MVRLRDYPVPEPKDTTDFGNLHAADSFYGSCRAALRRLALAPAVAKVPLVYLFVATFGCGAHIVGGITGSLSRVRMLSVFAG